MLRTQTEALAKNLKIPMENLRWYAAFHNESHHPHVHLIAYSTVENEGYLTQNGVENLRSSFAKDIFQQDLLCIYERQTEHRDKLRAEARDIVEDLVSKINSEIYISAHQFSISCWNLPTDFHKRKVKRFTVILNLM